MNSIFSKVIEWFGPAILLSILAIPASVIAGVTLGQMMVITWVLIGQNFSFTIVSRARQSSNYLLHGIAAIGSNGLFIFVITAFATQYNTWPMKIWYIICTATASIYGHYISMHKIESHKRLKKDRVVTEKDLDQALERFEEKLRASAQPQSAA